MGTQFVNNIKSKIPDCKIIIFHHDSNDKCDPKKLSYGTVRKYTSSDGTKFDPTKEWYQSFYDIDVVVSLYKEEYNKKLSFYPHAVGAFLRYRKPEYVKSVYFEKKFKKFKLNIEASKVNAKIIDLKKNGYKIISIHLRRNIKNIINFAEKINDQEEKIHFIILGSSEHDPLPKLPEFKSYTSLVDSYKQNINTIELLSIARKSDLVIGGRGGFEMFFWWSEIPSINIFDEHGFFEKDCFMWPRILWKHNAIKGPFSLLTSEKKLMNSFKEWLNKNLY